MIGIDLGSILLYDNRYQRVPVWDGIIEKISTDPSVRISLQKEMGSRRGIRGEEASREVSERTCGVGVIGRGD